MAGPKTNPAANAAPTYANAWPRFLGSTRSPTYAWVTPMLPPDSPSSARETSTIGIDGANASIVQAIVEPICETISTILRPMRSLTLPHTGPAISWHSENVANTTPTVMSGAPNFFTKNGISGIRMLNPRMSMNVMPRIGSSRKITSARTTLRCEWCRARGCRGRRANLEGWHTAHAR